MRRTTILIAALALVLLAGWPTYLALRQPSAPAQCQRDAPSPDVGWHDEQLANTTEGADVAHVATEEAGQLRTTAACPEHQHGSPTPPASTPPLPATTPDPNDGPPGPTPPR